MILQSVCALYISFITHPSTSPLLHLSCRLTRDVGLVLAELPLEPQLGRLLLASGPAGCSDEAATLCAMLSVPHLWTASHGAHRAQDEVCVIERARTCVCVCVCVCVARSVHSSPFYIPLSTT